MSKAIRLILIVICVILSFDTIFLISHKGDPLTNNFLTLSDNIDNVELEYLRDSDGGIDLLYDFNSFLNSNSDFDYIEMINNYTSAYIFKDSYKGDIKFSQGNDMINAGQNHEALSDNLFYEFEDRAAIRTFGLSDNANKYFELSMQEGNYFDSSNVIDSSQLSVILGNNYMEYYDLNDEIPLIYLGKEFKGVVRGFLNKGSNLICQNTKYILDNYIILPVDELTNSKSFEATDTKNSEISFILHKNNGIAVSNTKSLAEIRKLINNKCAEIGLSKYSFIINPREYNNLLNIRIIIQSFISLIIILKLYKSFKKSRFYKVAQ